MSALGDRVKQIALQGIAIEWRKQGHELSGQAVRNMDAIELPISLGIRIEGYLPDYMAYLNAGIPGPRIPYSPGSGARHSKYIEGLKQYAKARMNASDKEALGIAFAIASKHKREGMPTRSSARFSQTGKRTGFIEIALDALTPQIEEAIREELAIVWENEIETIFKSILNR